MRPPAAPLLRSLLLALICLGGGAYAAAPKGKSLSEASPPAAEPTFNSFVRAAPPTGLREPAARCAAAGLHSSEAHHDGGMPRRALLRWNWALGDWMRVKCDR